MVITFQEGDYLLKQWEPGDEEAILDAFNRVFARIVDGFRPRTLETWRWQFLANPSGKLLLSAVAPDGRVAAHHGFVGLRLRVDGVERTAMQVVDTFVDPGDKRGLQRTSLAAALMNRFVAHTGGDGPGRHAFYYGFPVRAALRVGESLGQYELVRGQLKLSVGLDELAPVVAAGVEVEEVERFPEETAALFARAAERHRAIGVRDAAHLNWRFAEAPDRSYRRALARSDGALVGYAVYRRGCFDGDDEEGLLVDWLVFPDAPAACDALLAWLRERAHEDGVSRLTTVLADVADEWLGFQQRGFRVLPTQYPMIVWTCVRAYDVDWLRAHWYYTLGDTDLV